MKYTNLDQGSQTGGAMMYEFVFDVRGQEPHQITAFSDSPGAALYRAHTHIQHELEISPSDYRLQKAARLLRNVQNKIASVVGSVPIEDLPAKAPLVEKRGRIKTAQDTTPTLDFMAEVPVLSKAEVERRKERESNRFLYTKELDTEVVE